MNQNGTQCIKHSQGKKKAKVCRRNPSSIIDVSDFEVDEVRPINQKMTKKKSKERNDTHATIMEINERKVSSLEKLVSVREVSKRAKNYKIHGL